MRALIIVVVFGLFSIYSLGQTTQNFERDFKTKSGVYGTVSITTQPTTVGAAYLWIQQNEVIVKGIRYEGELFNGNELAEYGISFPLSCSNCFFYADGTASMFLNGMRYYGPFEKRGIITLGGAGKTNQPVLFKQAVKDLHNELRKKDQVPSYWETTGRVEDIAIHDVKGADFGEIVRAAKEYRQARQQEKNFEEIVSKAKQTSNIDDRYSYLKQAEQMARTNQQKNEVASLLAAVKRDIQEQRESITQEENKSATASNETKSTNNSQQQETKTASKDFYDTPTMNRLRSQLNDLSAKDTRSMTPEQLELHYQYKKKLHEDIYKEGQRIRYENRPQGYVSLHDNKAQIQANANYTAAQQMYLGDYNAAALTYANAGMETQAYTALAVGVIDEIVNIFKNAKEEKIKRRTNEFNALLEKMESLDNAAKESYKAQDYDAFFESDLQLRYRENEAIELANWLGKKSKSSFYKLRNQIKNNQASRNNMIIEHHHKALFENLSEKSNEQCFEELNSFYNKELKIVTVARDAKIDEAEELAAQVQEAYERRVEDLFLYDAQSNYFDDYWKTLFYLNTPIKQQFLDQFAFNYFRNADYEVKLSLVKNAIEQKANLTTGITDDSKLVLLIGFGNDLNYFMNVADADKEPLPLYRYLSTSTKFKKGRANKMVKILLDAERKLSGLKIDALTEERKLCLTPKCSENSYLNEWR